MLTMVTGLLLKNLTWTDRDEDLESLVIFEDFGPSFCSYGPYWGHSDTAHAGVRHRTTKYCSQNCWNVKPRGLLVEWDPSGNFSNQTDLLNTMLKEDEESWVTT